MSAGRLCPRISSGPHYVHILSWRWSCSVKLGTQVGPRGHKEVMLQRGILAHAHRHPAAHRVENPGSTAMKSAIILTTTCLGLGLLTGCMQARIEESRELATPLAKGDRVVILAKPQIEGSGAEDEFMDCVGTGLNDKNV